VFCFLDRMPFGRFYRLAIFRGLRYARYHRVKINYDEPVREWSAAAKGVLRHLLYVVVAAVPLFFRLAKSGICPVPHELTMHIVEQGRSCSG
jgi:hypothetical protein